MLKLCQVKVNLLDNLKKINEQNRWEKFINRIDKEDVLEAGSIQNEECIRSRAIAL